MDELEQRMREQEREKSEHSKRMAAMADDAHRNLLQFVELMRKNQVPMTRLYQQTSEFVQPEPVKRFLRKPVPQKGYVERRYVSVGQGWVVEDGSSDGTSWYLVLDKAVAYDCRFPWLAKSGQRSSVSDFVDPPDLQQPYVVATGSLDKGEVFAFQGASGVDLLATNARKLLTRDK